MDGTGREVERTLEWFDLAAGAPFPDVDGWTQVPGEHLHLTARYYDTDDLRLARAGHALRYRSDDTGHGRWTLKTTRAQRGNQADRDEHDVVAAGVRVPSPLRAALRAVCGDARLRCTATIVTTRSTSWWHRADATVEVSRDHVSSTVGRRPGPSFHEIELELVAGGIDDLDALESAFLDAGARRSPSPSKLHRVLGDGITPAASHPTTVRDLIARAFDDALQRLMRHDPLLRLDPDVEAVHQARVATRRLRSDLRSLRPFLQPEAAGALHTELTWAAGLLGAVRDLDVLAEHISSHTEPGQPGRGELLARLAEQRLPHLAELQVALVHPRYLELVESIRRGAAAPPLAPGVDPDTPAGEAGTSVADRAWRRLDRGIRRLPARPEDEALHEIRKRAKQARYAHELVAPVTGGRIRRRASMIEDTQDLLGALQDTVVLRQWLRTKASDASPAAAFLAGELVAGAEHEAAALRKSFRRSPLARRSAGTRTRG